MKPWMTDELKRVYQRRNRFYKIYKKLKLAGESIPSQKSQEYHVRYKTEARCARKMDRAAEIKYQAKQFKDIKNSTVMSRLLSRLNLNYKKKIHKFSVKLFYCRPDCSLCVINLFCTWSLYPRSGEKNASGKPFKDKRPKVLV